MERGIALNELEKRSFYSFLALYLISSVIFLLLLGFWYYNAQKNALEKETYYKLEHLADTLSGSIINAQMKHTTLELPNTQGFTYKLIPIEKAKPYHAGYFEKNGTKVLVSDAPREHLNIAYVVVETDTYAKALRVLQLQVLGVVVLSLVFIVFISIFLARLFMKPLHNKMAQIESFIQDVSHELNTPITALGMSAKRAIKKGVYDKKILQNILISTKQLESLYNSLSYLNFKKEETAFEESALQELVEQTVQYYEELSSAKNITIKTNLKECIYPIPKNRAQLLFSNLLSNAIKYSMPNTTISLELSQTHFIIEDEGVGIAEEKLQEIFQLYTRNSTVAGGFGIGLHTVKQICDEYNIQLSVSSTLGKGSRFKLDLHKKI